LTNNPLFTNKITTYIHNFAGLVQDTIDNEQKDEGKLEVLRSAIREVEISETVLQVWDKLTGIFPESPNFERPEIHNERSYILELLRSFGNQSNTVSSFFDKLNTLDSTGELALSFFNNFYNLSFIL